jgi:hypothetical protein
MLCVTAAPKNFKIGEAGPSSFILMYAKPAIHHPFTAPSVDAKTLESTATTALSRAYDLVING